MEKLFGISLDDWYWSLKFGRSKKKLSLYDLRSMPTDAIPPPVFFLSTGRCGTKWFSSLLQKNPELMILHNPVPNLAIQGKSVYELFRQTDFKPQATENLLATELFWTGREQFIRQSFKTNKRIIETNNSISFFASIIAQVFPRAKFVHLYRHPGEFVRSAIRRGHYTDTNPEDIKRLEPIQSDSRSNNWKTMNQLQKCAWLWNETNEYIDRFKNEIETDRVVTFNFNNLGFQNVKNLLSFLDISLKDQLIKKHLRKKENVQSSGDFPKYTHWEDKQKKQLIAICGTLAEKYGYILS